MLTNEAIQRADDIVALARAPAFEASLTSHFGKYAEHVLYAAKQIHSDDRPPWFSAWVRRFRSLYDDFELLRAKDPMMVYRPLNAASESFHKSDAFIRYFRAGNRTSKTQSGYAEHYYAVTGFHPFRADLCDHPASTLIVAGLPFTDYAPRVFKKKFLYGEDGKDGRNPLSPMFPEGGKWFYRYDAHNHTIYIACPECAEKGKAGTCPGHHMKRTISLVSSEKGKDVVEGFTVRLMHGDEHIPEPFFEAMQMRVADAQGGGLIFTGTPLHGPNSWETLKLARIAEGSDVDNRKHDGPDSPELVSMHQCSMWDGNVVPHDVIRAYEKTLDEFNRRARIEGIPAAVATNPVFDREILREMELGCKPPRRGRITTETDLVEVTEHHQFDWSDDAEGLLRVWEDPEHGAQYVLAVDTAAGLSERDPSCATVLRLDWGPEGMRFRQVAQFHGWLPILDYSDEVFKLAVHYNSAVVIVELTGGYGRAVVERLKKELYYWNIFRDVAKGEYASFFQDARFGVDTSMYNKASMVGVLQQVVRDRRIQIWCSDTIKELVAYEQEMTDQGNARFQGAAGSHDDRVMALAIGVYTAISKQLMSLDEVLATPAPEAA